jgi:opacity protein-like surface antigen
VLQDDRTQGSTWGFRLPVAVVPYLTVEPYYASGSYGDKTETTIAGSATRDGGTVTAWGANLLILGGSPEFRFYPFAGLGSTTDARSGAADVTKTGYNFGAGVGFALPMKLGLDVRGELEMIVDGDVSRKFGNLTAGLSYHFLTLP